MKKFALLFEQIDRTQSTNEKVMHMQNYFLSCTNAEGAWVLFFLCGYRIKRLISSRMLLEWSKTLINLPSWLIEESYASVGDTSETIALLLPRKQQEEKVDRTLDDWMENSIKPLQSASVETRKNHILNFWESLSTQEIFILNKILTGSFRVGVSTLLTLKALSLALGISREILSQRIMGSWTPTAEFFESLRSSEETKKYLNPYPFYLAFPLEGIELTTLGHPKDWLIEWKWDGIRAQAVIREEGAAIWSRGNELISHQFPELIEAFKTISPGTVLDGEVLAYKEGKPLLFAELQKRLGRKNVSKGMIEQVPIAFMIYDILEYKGQDIRSLPLRERRALLKNLKITSPRIILSPEIEEILWDDLLNIRNQSKEKGTEGLMLKKLDSSYGVGRQKGFWWKYKVDPMTIDAVLIYAQAGSGRRANLFTDYTFGIWKDQEIIPITKAYSGLNQEEIKELDNWIRRNTEEKFGPVRKVKALQVFEIAFEGIQLSKRNKSGVALRFPRILRWRKDKPVLECDTLDNIKKAFLHEKS